eukprot:TRINITY_DN27617_c0_g1_i1.p3 TRINITY_DN27617_c0_g1~~TRINITY_DN27617_c0_g1_i1.p3  ORF type:complete len:137 (+),score=47.81 TRINITY_DN27617_c0_g1_i1:84-494(+)
MHVVECTSYDSARLVAEVMTNVGGADATGVAVRGEGRYVSTVSLAVAILCSDHSHAVRVGSWDAVPSDPTAVHASSVTPSLSVVFFPAAAHAAAAAAPTPLSMYTPTKHFPSPLPVGSATRHAEIASSVFNRPVSH